MYGYGDHRNLHSFPTRRSTDLTDSSINDVVDIEINRAYPGILITNLQETNITSTSAKVTRDTEY